VEGFIGGMVIAAVAGYILSIYYPELEWKQWVSIAILICVFWHFGRFGGIDV
jgi:phosphatidate cytidylyltransferase